MTRKHISVSVLILSALLFMTANILDATYAENKTHFWMVLVSLPLLLIVIWYVWRENTRG